MIKLNKNGFTLIELLVAIGITGLLIIGIMTFLTTTMVNNSLREARADLLREAQLTLDVITKDIRLSANVDEENRIADPYSPNAASTNGLGWESSAGTLILATAVEDTNRNIVFQDATHYITEKNNVIYFTQDGSLYKRILAADVEGNRLGTSCPAAEASSACPADVRLVQGVTNFGLRYFNSLDEEVPPSQARSVEVTLTLQKQKFGREVNAEYSTRTVFRNE